MNQVDFMIQEKDVISYKGKKRKNIIVGITEKLITVVT